MAAARALGIWNYEALGADMMVAQGSVPAIWISLHYPFTGTVNVQTIVYKSSGAAAALELDTLGIMSLRRVLGAFPAATSD